MDSYQFIIAAYVISGTLLAALCLMTWRAAVRTRRLLNERRDA
jgi:hypothetical protein